MLKKSLILIALFFVIAAISARAESLQDLINRKKIEAIAKVKPIVQKMINDKIEVLKKSHRWKDEYKNIENLELVYQAELRFNNKAFFYTTTTSAYSIIDTTKIANEWIYVLNKYHQEMMVLRDEGEGFKLNSITFFWNSWIYGTIETSKKIFKAELPLISLNSVCDGVLKGSRIFLQTDSQDKLCDVNDYLQSIKDRFYFFQTTFQLIRTHLIYNKINDLSYISNYSPKVKRDFSQTIKNVEAKIDSLDKIYLTPISKNKKSIYDLIYSKEFYFSVIFDHLERIGITVEDFIMDSFKLTIRPVYNFSFQNTIKNMKFGENILDSITFVDLGWGYFQYFIFWEDELLACLASEPCDEIYDLCLYELVYYQHYAQSKKSKYDWIIYCGYGSIGKSKDNIEIAFFSEHYSGNPIPYQQFLEEIIDEYSIRKLSGK